MRPAVDGREEADRLGRLYGSPPLNDIGQPVARLTNGKAQTPAPGLQSKNSKIPVRWRERLPTPSALYGAVLDHLSQVDADGFATAACPFHDDTSKAALSVRIQSTRGGWACAECGRGDFVEFVMRLRSVGFVDAVRYLVFEVAND